ncbi:MAG: serine/threonine-protein kinase [Pseudomonadota bacterium]
MADFSHPHLARFLDGDRDELGQPYYVMEHVPGVHLDEYVRRERLSVRATVELVRQVGEALAYAHSRAVLHRDIKPSNVLVTPEGCAKLLDFGIAKSLHDAPSLTQQHGQHFTASYAAPEQLDDQPARVQTDVYQLGLLLYELLTQCPAYGADHPTRSAVLKRIEQGLRPPSGRVLEAKRAWFLPAQRARELRGDLDAIVMKALRPQPDARFTSMPEWLANIDEWLTGRPVTARQGSTWYRATKWLHRHRAPSASAAVVLLVASVSALVLSGQARSVAEANLAADTTAALISDVFGAVDPDASVTTLDDGRVVVDAQALLDAAAEELRAREQTQHTIAPQVSAALGDAARSLGVFEQCTAFSRRADHPDAKITAGYCLVQLNRLEEAKQLADAVIAEERPRSSRDEHAVMARGYNLLGLIAYLQQATDIGRAQYSQALQRLDSRAPPTRTTCDTLDGLAGVEQLAADYKKAETWARALIECTRSVYGAHHSRHANALGQLAGILSEQSRYEEALVLFEQARAALEAVLPSHHASLGYLSRNMGLTQERLTRLASAETSFRTALRIFERSLGANHNEIAWTLSYLAAILDRTSRSPEAVALIRRAEEIAVANGMSGEVIAYIVGRHGRALARSGEFEQAIEKFEQALAVEVSEGSAFPYYARLDYANALLSACRAPTKARTLAEASFHHLRDKFGEDNSKAAQAQAAFGTALVRTGAPDDGLRHLRQATKILASHWPADHPTLVTLQQAIARAPSSSCGDSGPAGP